MYDDRSINTSELVNEDENKCSLCLLVLKLENQARLIRLNDFWTINEFQGALLRPRYVIQSRNHKESISELDSKELSAFSKALVNSIKVLESRPGVVRVYIESYNETAPGHLHIHLTPRFEGEGNIGPQLEDRNIDHWDWNSVWSELSNLPSS